MLLSHTARLSHACDHAMNARPLYCELMKLEKTFLGNEHSTFLKRRRHKFILEHDE